MAVAHLRSSATASWWSRIPEADRAIFLASLLVLPVFVVFFAAVIFRTG